MDEEKKCWAVIEAASGRLYLASVIHYDTDKPQTKSEIIHDIAMGNVIKCKPAYDYALGLSPGPGGLAKKCIVTPLGMTVTSPPLYLLAPSAIHFVEEMGEIDQKLHHDYIKEVEEVIEKSKNDGGAKMESTSPLLQGGQLPPGMSQAQLEQLLRGGRG